MQPLEPRCLLAANLVDGLLEITGSDSDDRIIVEPGDQPGQVVVVEAPGVEANAVFDGVQRIHAIGGDGDDVIQLAPGLIDPAGEAMSAMLDGGAGNDILTGSDGDDVLIGGLGKDQLNGADGSDTIDFSGLPRRVDVSLKGGVARGQGKDRLTSIENVVGSDYADRIRGDDGANFINGGAGRDDIFGLRGNDVLIGGAGRDEIRAAKGDDQLFGGNGDDRLFGGPGADAAYGGNDNDRIKGGGGDDVMFGGPGFDLIRQKRGDNDLISEEPGDVLLDREQNNRRGEAQFFDVGANGIIQLEGLVLNAGGRDYFQFVPSGDGMVRVDVAATNGNRPALFLEDRFGQPLAVIAADEALNTATVMVTADRSYFIRMQSVDALAGYRVTLTRV